MKILRDVLMILGVIWLAWVALAIIEAIGAIH